MADPIEVAPWEQRVAETSERLAQSEEQEAVLEQMQAEQCAVGESRRVAGHAGCWRRERADAEQRARFETMCNQVSTLLIEEKMTSVFGIQTNEGVNHAALLSIDEISKILLHAKDAGTFLEASAVCREWREAARPLLHNHGKAGIWYQLCCKLNPAARHFVNVASYSRLHWQLVEQRDLPMYWLQELRLEDLQFVITFTRYHGFPCGQQGGIKTLGFRWSAMGQPVCRRASTLMAIRVRLRPGKCQTSSSRSDGRLQLRATTRQTHGLPSRRRTPITGARMPPCLNATRCRRRLLRWSRSIRLRRRFASWSSTVGSRRRAIIRP